MQTEARCETSCSALTSASARALQRDHQNSGYKARLEFAESAVKDALRRVNDSGDARTILTSLDGIWIGDLNAAAAPACRNRQGSVPRNSKKGRATSS